MLTTNTQNCLLILAYLLTFLNKAKYYTFPLIAGLFLPPDLLYFAVRVNHKHPCPKHLPQDLRLLQGPPLQRRLKDNKRYKSKNVLLLSRFYYSASLHLRRRSSNIPPKPTKATVIGSGTVMVLSVSKVTKSSVPISIISASVAPPTKVH